MKKHLCVLLIFWSLGYMNLHAQVGQFSNNPNKNAALDLNRTDGTNNKGLLLPNVALTSTASAAPMSAHIAGMNVWNTATTTGTTAVTPGEYYNDGTKWIRIPAAWQLNNNEATDPAVNFIGTKDAQDFVTRTNNVERMRVTSTGKVLIGTSTVPTGGTNAKLIVSNGTTAGALQIKDGTEAVGNILTSDANGVGTWQPLSIGYRLMNVDLSSNPAVVNLTTFSNASYSSYQFITATTLTVTVPAGYTDTKVIIRWDLWGDVGYSPITNNQGAVRFGIKQTGPSANQYNGVFMLGWVIPNNGLTVRYNAPVTQILEGLAPGTYTFQLGAARESEVNSSVTHRLYAIQGKAEVYVK